MLKIFNHPEPGFSAFEDTLKHPDLSIDMALATIRLATQNDRLDESIRELLIIIS